MEYYKARRITTACDNVGESYKYYVKWKNLDKKECMPYDSNDVKHKTAQII